MSQAGDSLYASFNQRTGHSALISSMAASTPSCSATVERSASSACEEGKERVEKSTKKWVIYTVLGLFMENNRGQRHSRQETIKRTHLRLQRGRNRRPLALDAVRPVCSRRDLCGRRLHLVLQCLQLSHQAGCSAHLGELVVLVAARQATGKQEEYSG